MASAVQMRSWKWLAAKAMKLETVQLLSYYNSNIQQHYWFIGREKEKFCDKQAVILNLRLLQFYSNGESWRSKLWALGCSGLKLVGRNILTVFENYSKILILVSEAIFILISLKTLANAFLPHKKSSQFCDFTVLKESTRIWKNFQVAKKHRQRFQNERRLITTKVRIWSEFSNTVIFL